MRFYITIALFASVLLYVTPLSTRAQSVDSTLLGRNVFEWVEEAGPGGNHIRLVQSKQIQDAVNARIAAQIQSPSKISGYRVRIFFDNKQTARSESEKVAAAFAEYSPQTAIYRVYENPYFKVTVGDFRTKSDAVRFMNSIKETYPQAFITREFINYPNL